MNSLLLSLVLVVGASDHLTRPQDGTIIFLENSKRVVEKVTKSCITHVALVMNVEGEPFVYEAEPPKVRRVPLMTFYREIGERNRDGDEEIRVWVLPPEKKFTPPQRTKMKSYLDDQLGRRYSIKNYVRDVEGDGVHCAADGKRIESIRPNGIQEFPITESRSISCQVCTDLSCRD